MFPISPNQRGENSLVKKLLTALVAVGLFLVPQQALAEEITSSQKAANLAEVLVFGYGANSVQYALLHNGEIVISGGLASEGLHGSTYVSSDTMYAIGSVSKMYTTAAAMMLADRGLLDIDAPIVNYIPDFTMDDDRYDQITARMLMNHSAGFHGTTLGNAFLFDDNNTQVVDNFLYNLSMQDLKANPGEFSVYSNDSFTMLEILVERISGMTFTEFLHEYIFSPLGFENTKTPQDYFDRDRIALSFSPLHDSPVPTPMVNAIGTGGIFSTAEEVAIFADVLMGNRTDILSVESVEAMLYQEYRRGIWVNATENSIGFGLGWDSVNLYPFSTYGIQGVVKGGDTLYLHSSLVAIPEHNIAMVVNTSGSNSGFNMLMATRVLEQFLLEQGIIDEIAPEWEPVPPVAQEMPEEMQRYAGLYASMGIVMDVALEDGHLIILMDLEDQITEQKFVYTGEGIFQDDSGSVKISFEQHGDKIYMAVGVRSMLPGLGVMVANRFDGHMIESNPLTPEVRSAWEARQGSRYFVVSELATSQIYFASAQPFIMTISADLENGFFGTTRIVDENRAVNMLQLPIAIGRDTFNVEFFTDDDKYYVRILDLIAVSERHVEPIFSGMTKSTIPDNGHARWFTIGEDTANRIIHVGIPENGAFAVYDENGAVVEFSTVTGSSSSILPRNGTIVFIGDPNSVFNIVMS